MLRDKDLDFLKTCDNEDLKVLVDYLTKNKDGELRASEELSCSEAYKKNYPNTLHNCSDEIADELHRFGGNTVMNLFRGNGVLYKEIVRDVAQKLKVSFHKEASVERIEELILDKMFQDSIEKMDISEIESIIKESGGSSLLDGKRTPNGAISRDAMIMALMLVIRNTGFAPYKIAVIVANSVARALLGHGLRVAANATLTRALSVFAGPIGLIFMSLWTLLDIAGPAYRVTIPAVIQIAYMRAKANTDLKAIEAIN